MMMMMMNCSQIYINQAFSDVSAIKQYLMIKHNKDTDNLKSPDIKKILIDNTNIINKNNNKNRLQILEAIPIKIKDLL